MLYCLGKSRLGVFIILLLLGLSYTGYLLWQQQAKVRAYDAWVEVVPGETLETLIQRLGEPDYIHKDASSLISYQNYNAHIPEEFRKTHKLYVFHLDGLPSRLLYVFVREGRVQYVWSGVS